jgi:serine/threonine protein kinase
LAAHGGSRAIARPSRPFLLSLQVLSTALKRTPSQLAPATFAFAAGFDFEALVGASPRAQVWRARHRGSGDLFAIKRTASALGSRAVRDRWSREVGAVASLPPHPHLVGQMRAWQEGSHAFIQMEFVPGGSLGDLVRAGGALPAAAVWRVAAHAASGLAALHAAGVVHLDVKPDNIYIDTAQGRGVGRGGGGGERAAGHARPAKQQPS